MHSDTFGKEEAPLYEYFSRRLVQIGEVNRVRIMLKTFKMRTGTLKLISIVQFPTLINIIL
jgi:uncharacterized DUF497 family protein